MPRKKKSTKTPEERKTNPFGANQYLLDPRQKKCWDAYVNPKSPTFGNATQSAISAGYDEDYAEQITTAEWFLVKLRRLNLLGKSEKVLEETIDMPVQTLKIPRYSDEEDEIDEVEYVVTDPALVRVRLDAAKFVAERLGKTEGYTTRTEVSGPDGGPIEIADERKKEIENALDDVLPV